MASETTTETGAPTTDVPWRAGALAGLVAGAAMGLMLTAMMRPVIAVAIPALYGLTGLATGWVAHLVHGAVFGVLFAAVATRPAVASWTETPGRGVAAGAAYGVAVWLVAAALVMPVWLAAVGFPNAPPLPNVDPQSLVGHVVYGAVLGAAFASAR